MCRFIFILATLFSILMEFSCLPLFKCLNGQWKYSSKTLLQTYDFYKYLKKLFDNSQSPNNLLGNLSNLELPKDLLIGLNQVIKKQNKITNTDSYSALVDHIVAKGHFGYLLVPFTIHRENRGFVQSQRVETSLPRSIFLNNDLQKLQKYYNEKAINCLKSFPICYNKFQEYEDFISGMLTAGKDLCKDIFENEKYKTEKIIYCLDNNKSKDYNKGTIKIIVSLNESNKDKQNGWQPVYEKYSDHPFPEVNYYQPTTRICLYLKVQDGIVLIKSIFPVRPEFLDYCEEYKKSNTSDSEEVTLEVYPDITPNTTPRSQEEKILD